jgi:hypothetical protein
MGKVLGIIAGVVCFVLGIWGLVHWWGFFVRVLAGTIPALLIVAGGVLVVFFASEIRNSMKEKAEMAAKPATETSKSEEPSKKE